MFGYIIVNKPEMKFREFDVYHGYYCGLCRKLKEHYGKFGQITLSYDMVFVLMTLTSLYELETTKSMKRCVTHPLQKHEERVNNITDYVAHMNILLTYYKCKDDWNDDRKLEKLVLEKILYHKSGFSRNFYREKWNKINDILEKLSEEEKKDNQDIDQMSGHTRSRIDPQKCKECGMCAKACPYNAIAHVSRPCKDSCPVDAISYDEYGVSVIDEEKCIRCGQCAAKCPFGAIGTKTWITNVIADLKAGKKVYAILAPATEGQFGKDITMESWRQAVKKAGFEDLIEAGLGGDMTTCSEAEEWLEAYRNGEKKTTSCCPGFVNMIRKHYPDLADMISTTVSPMCAVSRMIKAKDPDAVTVFVGPCVAKKSEVADQKIEGNADYALNYNEILAILKAKDVELEPAENTYQDSTIFGKFYGNSGGVTDSVLEYMKETEQNEDIKVCKANGAAECKKALMFLQRGRLPEDFIEGMACEGGCVGGPSRNEEIIKARKVRETMIKSADDRKITDNLKRYDMDSFSMHR